MDYPAPIIQIKDGKLDFSNAYAVGIGIYDKWAAQFAYMDFPEGVNEKPELEKILLKGVANGYLFISDADTRPASAAHPLASLWDNGSDSIAELKHVMNVRRIGLNQFGLNNIDQGTPLSQLENKFMPLYLHHRYQTTATMKTIGGVYYSYAVRKGNSTSPKKVYEIVSGNRQRQALQAVLATIKSDELAIPARIIKLIPPLAYGYNSNRSELFPKRTRPVFDSVGAAEIAANMTIRGLLEPSRAARLITFNARNKTNPHFKEITAALINSTWKTPVPRNAYHAEVQRAVRSLAVTNLMGLAANESAQRQVRAVATASLRKLNASLKRARVTGNTATHNRATINDIEKFLARPASPRKQTRSLPNVPGDPIGSN